MKEIGELIDKYRELRIEMPPRRPHSTLISLIAFITRN